MRSRTSREVPEWSGGKELYIGSVVSAIGRVLGVTGNVPGPPEGSRGSTRWVHLSRRAPWAEVGREPALSGLGVGGAGPRDGSPKGGGGQGGGVPPKASGGATTLGFPTLGAGGAKGGGAPAHQGLVPSPLQPMGPSGIGGPTQWTPGTLLVVPVQYR